MSDSPSNQVIGNYKIGPEIGRGSFANVYKGYDRRTRQPVAVKSVFRSRLKNQKLIDNLEVEISILKKLKNPHIVGLLECIQTDKYFHLFMEYCSLGDLSYFIRKRDVLASRHPLIKSILERYPPPENSHGMNEVLVINFLKQLASALKFLRTQNLVHRDIKPQNLLLCPPAKSRAEFEARGYSGLWELPILKIADFGFARFLPNTSLAETLCGSPLYMAPEILRYEKYGAKADLWSVGAVIYEMAVGRPPFRAANHVELLKKIEAAGDRISFPASAQVSDDIVRVICSLLKKNPTDRMGFLEFFADPLVVSDVSRQDQPLNCSLEDDQLFISEYLPKREAHDVEQLKDIPLAKDIANVKVDTIVEGEEDEDDEDKTLKPQDTINRHSIKQQASVPVRRYSRSRSGSPAGSPAELAAGTAGAAGAPGAAGSFSNDVLIKNIINKSGSPLSVGAKLGHRTSSSSSGGSTSSGSVNLDRRHSSDVVVEKDYVVVERRTVEVNALADELNKAGSGAVAITQKPEGYRAARRYSSSSSASSHRGLSFSDRKTPLSISPSNALSRALGYTSSRLFGERRNSNAPQTSAIALTSASKIFEEKLLDPVPSGALEPISPNAGRLEDSEVITTLETLGTIAHAVSLFADVKFNQVIPLTPIGTDSQHMDAEPLPPQVVKTISEEGVALYVKTLSILAQAMSVASEWWRQNAVRSAASPKLNELVQWVRTRFNQSLERAEFLQGKLVEAKEKIARTIGDSAAEIGITKTQVPIAEKLIFDRALEMSRDAAMDELKGENLVRCELTYSTAIWMLESLLHSDDGVSKSCLLPLVRSVDKLDPEDRKTVEGFINSIGFRLNMLRRKFEIQRR